MDGVRSIGAARIDQADLPPILQRPPCRGRTVKSEVPMTAQGRRRSAEELTMEAVRLVEESAHSVARWAYDLGKAFFAQ